MINTVKMGIVFEDE